MSLEKKLEGGTCTTGQSATVSFDLGETHTPYCTKTRDHPISCPYIGPKFYGFNLVPYYTCLNRKRVIANYSPIVQLELDL